MSTARRNRRAAERAARKAETKRSALSSAARLDHSIALAENARRDYAARQVSEMRDKPLRRSARPTAVSLLPAIALLGAAYSNKRT